MMNKFTTIPFFIAALICYTSCQKNYVQNARPLTPGSAAIMGFKDSTQLIKSILGIYYDSTGRITDSATSYVYYDTLNKKITLRSENPVVSDEYRYNSAGLLVHFESSGDTTSVASIDYTYDASNILKTATVNEGPNGNIYTYSIIKTLLSSGNYQLSWLEPDQGGMPDSNYYFLNFDGKGKLLSYYDASTSDTILYDANDNIIKVNATFYTTPYDPNGATSFTLYDLSNRDTKGDQLYNLFQIIDNGVANIPPGIAVFGASGDEDLFYQLHRYPVLSTIINRPVGNGGYGVGCAVNPVTFNNAPQYDSQNRLVKYSTFFNDIEVSRSDYIISYYK